jgi:hypothetical protein
MAYLICQSCCGYYELDEDETPSDFDSCQCGGQLVYTEYLQSEPRRKGKRFYLALSVLIFITVLVIALFVPYLINEISASNPTVLGADYRGTVTKDIFMASNANPFSNETSNQKKIAIITGMHPREISAKNELPAVIKSYTLTHNNVEIVNYQINVTNYPENYRIGRHNGESLVAQYVIPDIKKSNYSLVIIVHNHIIGYGNGYYVATPSMDPKSISLSESIHNILPDFNFYERNIDQEPEETSINAVDNPIVATGTPVFVYEIPEWIGASDVVSNSDRFIDAVFKVI